jgi:hypothetical protein
MHTVSSDSFGLPLSRSVEILCMHVQVLCQSGSIQTYPRYFNHSWTLLSTYMWLTNVSQLRQLLLVRSFVLAGARLHFFPYNQLSTHSEGLLSCLLTYLLIYRAEPFLRSCQLCSPSGTPQHFMEPVGSIPCSQEPSTGPYPEPYQSNPLHPILSLQDPLQTLFM